MPMRHVEASATPVRYVSFWISVSEKVLSKENPAATKGFSFHI